MMQIHVIAQESAFIIKRLFDVVIGCFALIPVLFLFPFIFVAIKLDGGPLFYKQPRVGKDGKLFDCFKFRTMVENADALLELYLMRHPEARAEWVATQKLKNDPRRTKVGKILRHYSLDELPQLINVLRGDMSVVGPRPIVSAEVHRYAGDIVHYYSVRPGLTGLWQVSGRNDVSYNERVRMDSFYVRNWSLGNDLEIIFRTFFVLLNRSGAY